jgi:hypothetical protein
MEDNLARKIEEPRDKGVDGAGRTFRERIEVTLEDDGPEWDEDVAISWTWDFEAMAMWIVCCS